MNTCDITRRLLPEYIDHSLSQQDSDSLEAHLSGCPVCRTELRQLLEVVEAAKGIRKAEPPEPKRLQAPLNSIVIIAIVTAVAGILVVLVVKQLLPKPKSQAPVFVASSAKAPVVPVIPKPVSVKEIVVPSITPAVEKPVEKDVIDVYSPDPGSALEGIRDALIADGFTLVSLDNQQLPYLAIFIAPAGKTVGLVEKLTALAVGEVKASPFSAEQGHGITFSIRIYHNH